MAMPEQPDQRDPAAPTVFISYIHDNERHREAVLAFATFLVGCGIDVILDRWEEGPRQDWSAWALERIPDADYVIVIASERFRIVGDGHSSNNQNLGGQSEAAVLRELLHRDRKKWLPKLVPVVLPNHNPDEIPLFLQPWTADHYRVESITEEGAESLLRMLTRQPRDVRPVLGPRLVMPPRSGPCGPTFGPASEPAWTDLDVVPRVVWRAELMARHFHKPQSPTVELHLVPVGRGARIGVQRLELLKEDLATLGRSQRLFSSTQQLETGSSTETAWVYSTDQRAGEAGVAISETGQRTCWFALPRGTIGSVLDQQDLVDQLGDRIDFLAEIDVPSPQEVALAIGMDPVGMVRLGSLSQLSAQYVSIPLGIPPLIRLEPKETLPFSEFSRSARAIARELTARLAAVIRGGR